MSQQEYLVQDCLMKLSIRTLFLRSQHFIIGHTIGAFWTAERAGVIGLPSTRFGLRWYVQLGDASVMPTTM